MDVDYFSCSRMMIQIGQDVLVQVAADRLDLAKVEVYVHIPLDIPCHRLVHSVQMEAEYPVMYAV